MEATWTIDGGSRSVLEHIVDQIRKRNFDLPEWGQRPTGSWPVSGLSRNDRFQTEQDQRVVVWVHKIRKFIEGYESYLTRADGDSEGVHRIVAL